MENLLDSTLKINWMEHYNKCQHLKAIEAGGIHSIID